MAAILAVDVVGYSRLVERDEAGTLAAIKRLRGEAIEPLLAKYHGRIVKLLGDGVLAEFASVVDAVSCAVATQDRRWAVGPRRLKSGVNRTTSRETVKGDRSCIALHRQGAERAVRRRNAYSCAQIRRSA